ncbi:MAG: T9SS type A sorting domain-containing protein [Bacteroidaceae bacterium]|nr:T9SS type A sorting domain-containing protein [Bacteroidaceae bacterium]
MKKIGLIILGFMLLAAPNTVLAEGEQEVIENTLTDVTLRVANNKVRVSGANGQVMEIFNLTGVKVATIRIESGDKSYNLNLPQGCYILKVGKIVRKISIQ